jgi:hypothetical protein
MVEAARAYNRVIYSSTLTRSMAGFREAARFAIDGHLGKPLYIHAVRYGARTSIGKVAAPTPIPTTLDYNLWCGPAPMKPLMRQNLHYDWHWDWDTGNGELGNWGIHLLDGAREVAGQGMPKSVLSIGGRFGYDDDGQTPNTQITFFDYEPLPIIYEMRALPRASSSWKNGAWGQQDMDARTASRTRRPSNAKRVTRSATRPMTRPVNWSRSSSRRCGRCERPFRCRPRRCRHALLRYRRSARVDEPGASG